MKLVPGGMFPDVDFSSPDPQCLISVSQDRTVQQWGVDGCKIWPLPEGYHIKFSSNDTNLFCGEETTIKDSNSGIAVAKCFTPDCDIIYCYFFPDGGLLVGAANCTVYV